MRRLFLPVTVDPGRRKVFTAAISHSEHVQEFRSCSSKERQSFAGTDRRRQKVEKLKEAAGIKRIESQIPTLFRFYNHQSAPFRFYNYQGNQRSTAEMGNILLNGGKKYNKSRRKKTNRNKRRKRRRNKSRNRVESQPTKSNCMRKEVMFKKSKFLTSNRVPVVVFGDGLKNKENTRMKGQLPGASGVLLRSLHQRTKQLTAATIMINEHNTSKVCSSC